MVGGRIVWAAVRVVMTGVASVPFTWQIFLTEALVNAIPGIILQLIFIPALMVALDRTGMVHFRRERAEALELQNQLARRSRALETLCLDRADGLIGREEFAGMSARFREERQALQDRLDALEARMREAPPEPPGLLAKRAEALLRLDPMPRELLVLLVDTVTVGERRPDGTQEVSIRWLL